MTLTFLQCNSSISVLTISINSLLLMGFLPVCRFRFPTVIIVYQTIPILGCVLLDLLRYVQGHRTLCSSTDLIESLSPQRSTIICQITGKNRFLVVFFPFFLLVLIMTYVYV